MKSLSEGFVQAYNAQIVVELEMQMIAGQAMIADSGYCSEKDLENLESHRKPEEQFEALIATERQRHGEWRVAPRGRQSMRHR